MKIDVDESDLRYVIASESDKAAQLEAHAAKLESHLQRGVSAAEIEAFRSEALDRAAVHRARAARLETAMKGGGE